MMTNKEENELLSQYKELGTIEEIKQNIKELEYELSQYRKIGTVKECLNFKNYSNIGSYNNKKGKDILNKIFHDKYYCSMCQYYDSKKNICTNSDSEYNNQFRIIDDTCIFWREIQD